MKQIWISLLLFLLVYGERIPVTVERCDKELIVHDGSASFAITMYDIYDYEMTDVCAILLEADEVEIEWEADVTDEQPYPSWIFADGRLVQAELVLQEKAKVTRYNPAYAYIEQLREASASKPVQAPLRDESTEPSKPSGRILWVVVIGAMLSWVCGWIGKRLSD